MELDEQRSSMTALPREAVEHPRNRTCEHRSGYGRNSHRDPRENILERQEVVCRRIDGHVPDQHDGVRDGLPDHDYRRDQQAERIEICNPSGNGASAAPVSPFEIERERAKKGEQRPEPVNADADETLVLITLAIRISIREQNKINAHADGES